MKHHPLRFLRNRFLRDTATLQIGGILNQASQMASTVAIAFLLGSAGQGAFALALALQASIYFLLNVGVWPATVSQIAASSARGNHEKTAGWIAFMAKTVVVCGVIVVAGGAFVLPAVGAAWYDKRELGVWAWWLCAQPLLDMPRVVAAVAFQGTRRMLALAQVENAQELVRLFLVVLGAAITGSPEGAVIGTLVSSAIGSLLAVELYRAARHDGGYPLPGVREIARAAPEIPILRGLRLGIRVGVLKNTNAMVLSIIPRLIIGGVAGLSWVAYFHIAHRILSIPTMFMLGVSRTTLPALGELAGKRDMAGFRRLFTRATLLTGGILSAAILVSLPLVRPLTALLFPPDYPTPVFHFTWILALGYIPFTFAVALESFYIATNQVRMWLWLSLLGAILLVPVNVVLILSVPIWGTVIGLAVYQNWVLVQLAYIFWFLYRKAPREGIWSSAGLESGR